MSARLMKGAGDAPVGGFAPFMMPGFDALPPVDSGPVYDEHEDDAASVDAHALVESAKAEAAAQAAAIIADARTAAARVVDEANARAAEVERLARDRGLAEARAVVDEEINLAVEPLRAELAATLDHVAGLGEAVADRAERDLLRLALEIARKVVHRETTMDPEIAVTLVRVALSRLHSRVVARVRLHPEDRDYVASRTDRFSAVSSLELVADPSIARGGCLVETDMGDVDARIERQFAEIERGLLGA